MTSPSRYLDPRTLGRITRLDVRARQVVEGFVAGLHQSPFHGFAIEFANHREYVAGDETRHIDWKVWAKADRLYVKQYEEETNLACTILLDCSRSMAYSDEPDSGMSKYDYAATAAACLAYLMRRQQDAVGLVVFDRAIRRQLGPSTQTGQFDRLVYELEQLHPDDRTDVADVFAALAQQTRRRGLIVLLSDLFVDLPTLTAALRQFRHQRHEVVVCHVLHEDELTFPFDDPTMFEALESDAAVRTEPRALRRAYLERFGQYLAQVRQLCGKLGADYVRMNTAEPLDAALSAYLAARGRRS